MIYAIGDIHGQIEALDAALDLIAADGGPDAPIIFLGDYVDRGPASREVVGRLYTGYISGRPWTILRGNHDRMFVRFVTEGNAHDGRILSGNGWLHPSLGGVATLASYGVKRADQRPMDQVVQEAQTKVLTEHLSFLKERPLWHETDDLLFVHAGIRPGIPLGQQEEDDLIWIRDGFLDHPAPYPKLVVHGHTALDRPEHLGVRIDLDGGAGYGRPLVPAVFEGTDCWLLTPGGRVPLRPPGEA